MFWQSRKVRTIPDLGGAVEILVALLACGCFWSCASLSFAFQLHLSLSYCCLQGLLLYASSHAAAQEVDLTALSHRILAAQAETFQQMKQGRSATGANTFALAAIVLYDSEGKSGVLSCCAMNRVPALNHENKSPEACSRRTWAMWAMQCLSYTRPLPME